MGITKIIKSDKSATGLAISVDGKVIELNKFWKDGNSILLPENPANRKWFKASQMKGRTEIVLEYKETRVFGPRAEGSAGKKSWVDYLNDEDKLLYDSLRQKGEKAKADDVKKPKTELEKRQLAYEKAKAAYEKLLANESKEDK